MKKRLLTVLLAVCLVVALGTVTALADDDSALPTAIKSFVFANGTPITISSSVPDGATLETFSSFTATGNSAYISWNDGGTIKYIGVNDQVSVYGGGNGTVTPVTINSTNITMTGGRIKYLYGGNYGANNSNKESLSKVTGDVVMNISGTADVAWLLHGGGSNNTCVEGTVYMNFTNVDLSDQSDYLYVNGGVYGNGKEGSRDIENGEMNTFAVANNVVITATDSKFALFGVGGSGSTKVINGSVTLNDCTVDTIFFSGINGEVVNSYLELNDCDINIFSATNRGFVGDAIADINSTNIDTLESGATSGCFSSDSGSNDGSGVTGSTTFNIDANSTIEKAVVTPTVIRSNASGEIVYDSSINDVTFNKSGTPLDIAVEEFVPVVDTSTFAPIKILNNVAVPENSTLTLNNTLLTVSSGQSLMNAGSILMDSSSSLTISSNATFENAGAVDGTVDATEGTVISYPVRIGSKGYTTLGAAIDAAEDGDTITLVGNVDETINLVITGKNLTIEGNGQSITTEVGGGATSIGVQLVRSSLTLNDVDWTFTPNTNGGTAIDVQNNGSELTLNNSTVTINGTKRGMVMSATADSDENLAKINILNGSVLNVSNLSGNGSNGGAWTVTDSTINMNGIGNHALSVESIVIDNSVVDISDVGYCGIMGKDVELKNGSDVSVTESGKVLPYPNDGTSSTWAPDGRSYKRAVEIKKNGSLDVNNSTLVLSNNKNISGEPINVIYISEGSKLTTSGNYSIVADIESVATETQYYTVTYVSNNSLYTSKIVSSEANTHKLLTAPTRSGYTFGGWRVNNSSTVVKGGTSYTVTADTTFTAIWNAINIPDTYDIEIADTANGEVSTSLSNASAGSTITITAEPDTGYSVGSVTVTGPDGRVDVTRVNATTYTFKMPEGDVTVRVTFTTGLPFTDVSANQWFYDAISYVYTNGMMEGDSATTFNPDGQMTRAMFWAVLGRIDGATITGANWVETARSWAMAEGVSDGTNPNDYVTREMMVTMLWRYAGEPASEESLSAYTDAASVSDWAAEAMSWALETGVIEGVTATTLQPQGTATRAQCATIFMRYDMI